MTVFALVFSLVLVVLLVGLMLAMPAIVPRGIPLGVAVPQAHLDDPAVAAALRRFRIGQVAAGLVAVIATIVLALVAPVAGAVAPVFVFLVPSAVVYVVTRQGIVAAKRAGGWYDDVPVRLSAEVTAPLHHRPPLLWSLIAIVLLVAAAGIGAAVYPHLPDPYPVHYSLGGAVDRTAQKSVLAVFGPLLIGAAVAVVLAVVAALVQRAALRIGNGDDPGAAARRRGVLAALVAELSAAVAGGIAVIMVLSWLAPGSGAAVLVGILLQVALIAVVLVVAIVRLRAAARAADPHATTHDAPDDDRHWKAGLLYVNRDDPALWVPKRFGVGWTINAGHPAGIVILVLTVLVLAGAIVAACLGIRAR